MGTGSLLTDEQLHATTTQYLLDGGNYRAVELLTLCSLSCQQVGGGYMQGSYSVSGVLVTLTGPRVVRDVINDRENPLTKAIEAALDAVLGPFWYVDGFVAALEPVTPMLGWKAEMAERVRGQETNNQAKDHSTPPPQRWQGLGFRSVTEVVVAKALEATNVLFLPLCATRVTLGGEQRGTLFPDFLVCADGKWGIMEVDGEPYHPPGTAAKDHRRDRYFKQYGIKVVEHYTATECFNDPDGTVRKFLAMLRRNG